MTKIEVLENLEKHPEGILQKDLNSSYPMIKLRKDGYIKIIKYIKTNCNGISNFVQLTEKGYKELESLRKNLIIL